MLFAACLKDTFSLVGSFYKESDDKRCKVRE